MDIRDIKYVVITAEEMSFSKAAEKLFISQPALSQAIKKLEKELNISLFIRKNNKIKLTPAGKLFVEDGAKIINMCSDLKAKMMDIINTKEDLLRIGISPFYSNYYLPKIVPTFRNQYPAVTLEIEEKNSSYLEEDIINDKLDFCMIPLPITYYDEIEYETIYKEQILFAIPKSSMLNKYLTPALSSGLPFIDLKIAKNEPFIFLKKMQKFTGMGMRLCKEAGFTPNIVFETTNWDTINALIAKGIGVGFVPEVLVETTPKNKRPTYCRIMSDNTTRFYVAAYKKGSYLSSAAKNFIRIAKSALYNE